MDGTGEGALRGGRRAAQGPQPTGGRRSSRHLRELDLRADCSLSRRAATTRVRRTRDDRARARTKPRSRSSRRSSSCDAHSRPKGTTPAPCGGNWRVLRWPTGHNPPILATEGRLPAIGVQLPLAKMRVTILDVGTGRWWPSSTRRRALELLPRPSSGDFGADASPRRGSACCADAEAAQPPAAPRIRARKLRAYRIELYSLRGRRIAVLGTAAQPPLVSHMHLVERESVEGDSVLVERSVLGGASRRLIGFNERLGTSLRSRFAGPRWRSWRPRARLSRKVK
jgi:hypothetical protein